MLIGTRVRARLRKNNEIVFVAIVATQTNSYCGGNVSSGLISDKLVSTADHCKSEVRADRGYDYVRSRIAYLLRPSFVRRNDNCLVRRDAYVLTDNEIDWRPSFIPIINGGWSTIRRINNNR